MSHPALLAIDVKETLLDRTPLVEGIEGVIGRPVGEWFTRTLHGSLVANEVGWYRPFDEIGVESVRALASQRGLNISQETARGLLDTMTQLPLQAGVYNALEKLFDAGFSMIALTNNSIKAANEQIENAGLHIFLQRVVSVEEVELFKPAAEVYLHAAKTMETEISQMMVVSANDWDCAGAMATGAKAAFVRRTGADWSLPSPIPELAVDDIAQLADVLVGAT